MKLDSSTFSDKGPNKYIPVTGGLSWQIIEIEDNRRECVLGIMHGGTIYGLCTEPAAMARTLREIALQLDGLEEKQELVRGEGKN